MFSSERSVSHFGSTEVSNPSIPVSSTRACDGSRTSAKIGSSTAGCEPLRTQALAMAIGTAFLCGSCSSRTGSSQATLGCASHCSTAPTMSPNSARLRSSPPANCSSAAAAVRKIASCARRRL